MLNLCIEHGSSQSTPHTQEESAEAENQACTSHLSIRPERITTTTAVIRSISPLCTKMSSTLAKVFSSQETGREESNSPVSCCQWQTNASAWNYQWVYGHWCRSGGRTFPTPPMRPKPTPTRLGDITSTTDPVPKATGESNSHTPLILDLSEELVQLNNTHEEVAKEAMEHIQQMNSVGIFLESLEIGPLGFWTVNSHQCEPAHCNVLCIIMHVFHGTLPCSMRTHLPNLMRRQEEWAM